MLLIAMWDFRADVSIQLSRLGFVELLSLSKHTNPYCMHIKLSKKLTEKCIECQRKVIAKCAERSSFTGVCHADVLEYIYAVKHKNNVFGFISVSGFRNGSNKRFKSGKLQKIYERSLSGEPVPVDFLNKVIPPLAAMLVLLCQEFESPGGMEKNSFQRVLHYVRERHSSVRLDDIAREFNYSKSYISHIFKKASGHSLRSFCNILKIEDAKELLQNTDYSVTDIANAAGFSDFSYFIKVFRQQTEKTPLQWRKEYAPRE